MTTTTEILNAEIPNTEIPKWTKERKGVVDGGFDVMGVDQAGTTLWGYYHKAEQSGPSYFLASSKDRQTGEETCTYCSCPSHFWAVKTGDTTHECKHMSNLTQWLKG